MFSRFQRNNALNINPKQRLFGSAENALMHASQQHQGYMKFGEVLHLEGPYISLEVLSTAVRCLQRRHPVLRSRLQINADKPNSYLIEEDDTLQLKIRDIPRKRAEHLTFWQEEWRKREKGTTAIGEGLAEFWLLQDPDDINNDRSPREIVIICEHSVSDGLSLSNAAHELLIALSDKDNSIFVDSLPRPMTMEEAVRNSLSFFHRIITLGRFILAAVHFRTTNKLKTAKIPLVDVDFPLSDMANYCHTEMSYATLNKEDTQKLVAKCRQEGITVTSAVSSAILCAISAAVKTEESQSTILNFAIGADTRRRCIPPIPNHDLSYHVSGMLSFITPTSDIPTTTDGMWELAKTFGQHMQTCINAGQILALGLIMGKIYEKTLGPPNLNELPTCGVSSWGNLPFQEQYNQWKLVAMTPFVNFIRGLMPFTIIQTVNGILTILLVGTNPVIPASILEKVRDDILQKLHQMIKN